MINRLKLNMELTPDATDFIDDDKLHWLIDNTKEDLPRAREIFAKSLSKQPLTVEETAVLLAIESKEGLEELFETAKKLKRTVYGNRIVLFAPLYIGNLCVNNCKYCGFKNSSKETIRKTLSGKELVEEIENLEKYGHKRLILVFGESPKYTPEFIAECVKTCYSVKVGNGEIRRVNINAAPLDIEGFKTVKEAGIGTYQIFQETYHKETYSKFHPAQDIKGNYMWRLNAMDRAFTAGIDDMGIGALFGLYKWKFEVLGLVTHANYLKNKFGVGPHTISFPRIQPATDLKIDLPYKVSDDEFKRLVAILRLAVPYTGLIMTARESEAIRDEVIEYGVSQIDAGTKLEIGGYKNQHGSEQELKKEQFQIGDTRELDETMAWLLSRGFIPSFCTACYRMGRTGEHFMEFAIPGFIKRFCTPNAILTLAEYLEDYASDKTKEIGYNLIEKELEKMAESVQKDKIIVNLEAIKTGKRDFRF
ncbi:MAG: [FeFe] hydrogenase H-cluster radical SAM maturase HydG [Bacteroidales bacterium]|nr:[FeFe] hydrogenase H-cluster radical SAM maturase HydG [Bacteroidales bacterium]MBQ5593868.1 [FeFe] hydrogenase H-cluster radical SAM maturase HydG [Bacteroidales bacterium]